jgi:hypothetical protein
LVNSLKPSAVHVGAVVAIVGTAGVGRISSILNAEEFAETQLPLLAATS